MAAQDPHPPPWHDSMSDGCSCPLVMKPFMWPFRKYCLEHDEKYHAGGDWVAKAKADVRLYNDIHGHSWYGRLVAQTVYNGVRAGTYNFPPQHELRSWRTLTKAKAWNFEGQAAA